MLILLLIVKNLLADRLQQNSGLKAAGKRNKLYEVLRCFAVPVVEKGLF